MPPVPPAAAVIGFSPLHGDARVRRQIRALSSLCDVTAMGFTDPGIAGVRFVDVNRRPLTVPGKAGTALLLKAGCFEAVNRSDEAVGHTADALKGRDFALIVANDVDALPVALAHGRGAKILFDAHEYAPREHEQRFLWRFFVQRYREHLCRTGIPRVDGMTTVGPAIAEAYARAFGVRPAIVLNAPYHRATPCTPRSDRLIRMVHHGIAVPQRRLETLIDAMAHLDDRFRLDFMLVPSRPRCLAALKRRAASDRRISFVPPVASDEIVRTLSDYDVGVCAVPPEGFSLRHALPNKFFDFIQARLCIAIGPSPEMKRLVERHDLGVVAADFTAESLAEVLGALDRPRVEAFRRAADIAAAELCYERSAEVLQGIVRRLLDLEEPDSTCHVAPTHGG